MKKIACKDLERFSFLSQLKWSPDGESIAFVQSKANLEDNEYDSDIFAWKSGQSAPFRLTAMKRARSFCWLEDGKSILFPEDRDPKDAEKKKNGEFFTRFFRISIDGGEATPAFQFPQPVTRIEHLGGDMFLVGAVYSPQFDALIEATDAQKPEVLKKGKDEKDYEVLDEIPFWSNGQGFTNKKRIRLYLFDAASGKAEALSDPLTNVDEFELSPSKKRVALVSMRFENRLQISSELSWLDLPSKETKSLTHQTPFLHGHITWADENRIVFSGTDMKTNGINEDHRFFCCDLETNKTECLTPDQTFSIGVSVGSDCRFGQPGKTLQAEGGEVFFLETCGYKSLLKKHNKQGQVETVVEPGSTVDGFSLRKGKLAWIGQDPQGLQEIFLLNDGKVELPFPINCPVLQQLSRSQLEYIPFTNSAGISIDGWVLPPLDRETGKRYPTILDIHGGPKGVYGENFFHEMQVWASHGYAVLFCNPRGSDGKGDEFSDIRGKYGHEDYQDIMEFVDHALKTLDYLDPEKMGVTGGSYGGFMTNWIIGHTDRFKAAASQRSISNWISKFCTTDIGYFFVPDQNQGTPWDNMEKLWHHSPLQYAPNVKTPTLFIHSEEDYRCWLAEGLQMFTALKYFGVPSRLVLFKGENHELSRSGKPKHRIRRLEEITNWFDKYLK